MSGLNPSPNPASEVDDRRSDPYPQEGQSAQASPRSAGSAPNSGARQADGRSSAVEQQNEPRERLVASEAALRTTNRLSAGVVLAGAATVALYGAKILRDSRDV